MAEINLSAEQLDKLKAAMAKVKGTDAQSPQAGQAAPFSQAGQAAQPPQADAAGRQQPTAPEYPQKRWERPGQRGAVSRWKRIWRKAPISE